MAKIVRTFVRRYRRSAPCGSSWRENVRVVAQYAQYEKFYLDIVGYRTDAAGLLQDVQYALAQVRGEYRQSQWMDVNAQRKVQTAILDAEGALIAYGQTGEMEILEEAAKYARCAQEEIAYQKVYTLTKQYFYYPARRDDYWLPNQPFFQLYTSPRQRAHYMISRSKDDPAFRQRLIEQATGKVRH